MRKLAVYSILGALALLMAVPPCSSGASPDDSDQPLSARSRPIWNPFSRPAKSNPADQLAYADTLRERGSKKALKQYRALPLRWPDAVEAPVAQRAYAELLADKGKMFKAFEEYQVLVDLYSGRFAEYDEVLDRQYELAMQAMRHRRAKFLFLPGFVAPEQSLPLFEELLENGPHWERAPEVQYQMGEIHYLSDEYELAIIAYERGLHTYPDSVVAERCAYGRAYCLYLLAEENQASVSAQKEAWAAWSLYLMKFPEGEDVRLAKEYRNAVHRRMAKSAYEQALFYERVARKPQAALMAYREFTKEFPSSEWTGVAESRIDSLSKELKSEGDSGHDQ